MVKIEQNFLGIWELEEWVVEKPNAKKTFPFSGKVNGFLMYHPEGWMSATLMQEDRKDVSNDRTAISEISNLLNNKTEIFPYEFIFNYDFNKIKVNYDKLKKLN